MRRVRAEWLLLPLFLVPVLAGFGYVAWARKSYRADLDRAVGGASELVRMSVEGDRGSFYANQRFDGAISVSRGSRYYSLSLPTGDGRSAGWMIGIAFPQGAQAADLADEERRGLLESGTPAATFAGPYPVFGLRRFAAIYREPTLEAVRDAQMPPSTVLFLLNRLPEDATIPEGREVAREMLQRVAALHAYGDPPCAGLHRTKAGLVFRNHSAGPPFFLDLLPEHTRLDFKRRTMNDQIAVVYGDRPSPDAIWSEELDAPVKGIWSLEAIHGLSWWDVPRYRQWVQPNLLAAVTYWVVLSALALSMRRRRQLDEARARFLTEIAHDLRTPLTAVRLHAELLASPKRRADREEKYLGVLEREAVRASELLANLLDLSRLDRGQRVYEPETRRISDLIQPCVAEFGQLYPDRADDLVCVGDPELSTHIDASAFQRCVTNLLDNAGKYTDPGTSIRLVWSDAVMRVEDDGPGVPSRERSRLFQRYVRGSRTDGIAGTGLGLSLVKELMEGMGGTVEYRDGDPGVCFELRLPGGERA